MLKDSLKVKGKFILRTFFQAILKGFIPLTFKLIFGFLVTNLMERLTISNVRFAKVMFQILQSTVERVIGASMGLIITVDG